MCVERGLVRERGREGFGFGGIKFIPPGKRRAVLGVCDV